MCLRPEPLSILLLAACLFGALKTPAQSSADDLRQYFNTIRQTPYQPLPASALTDTNNADALLDIIIPHCSDSTEMVGSKAYYALKRIGQKSTSESVHRRAVHQLVAGMRDASSGIAFVAIDALTGFASPDFAEIDRDSIGTFIRPNGYHLDEAMKLAGYLQLTNFADRIRDIVTSTLPAKFKWNARIALARMGDEDAIRYIEQRLEISTQNTRIRILQKSQFKRFLDDGYKHLKQVYLKGGNTIIADDILIKADVDEFGDDIYKAVINDSKLSSGSPWTTNQSDELVKKFRDNPSKEYLDFEVRTDNNLLTTQGAPVGFTQAQRSEFIETKYSNNK